MRSQLAWAFGLQRGNSSPGGGFGEVPGEWKCPPPGGGGLEIPKPRVSFTLHTFCLIFLGTESGFS